MFRVTRMARFVTVTLCCALVLTLVPAPDPASATGTDIAHTAPANVTVSASFDGSGDQSPPSPCVTGASAIYDADDGSCWSRGQTSNTYTNSGNGFYVQFAANGSATPFDMLSFRLKWTTCQYGFSWNHGGCSTNVDYGDAPHVTHFYVYCDDTSGDPVSDPLVYDSGAVTLGGGVIGENDTTQIDLDDACHVGVSETRRLHVKYTTTGGNAGTYGQAVTVSSFEVYAVGASAPTTFEDYVYGLRITHPPFRRDISWWWKQTWDGTWTITNEAEENLGGGLSGGVQATPVYIPIQCIIVCGHDTYTITIHPDGHEVATYEIDSDSDGYLILKDGGAVLSYVEACYNKTTDLCADPNDGASDSMGFTFTLTDALAGFDTDGTVSFGREDITEDGCVFFGSPVTTAVISSPGTYTQIVTAWAESAGYFDTDGKQYVLVKWTSALDPEHTTCKELRVDVATGGLDSIKKTPVATETPCPDGLDGIGCFLGSALREALGGAEDVWSDAVGSLHDAAASKLPFAYVVLALDGVNEQLSRAALAVESSDDCPGVTLNVPLAYGVTNLSASPSPFPITVLTCAQLEPVMGQDWYQAVRTMMDPALWLLFAWAELKALQPKTSLTG